MSYFVWVGPRDIDCAYDTLFSDSICYYSGKNMQPFREAKIYGSKFNKFIKMEMLRILEQHSDAKFVFYNPKTAYYLSSSLHQYILCLNDKNLLNLLNDKIYTRYWLRRYVPVLPSVVLDAPYLSFQELENSLGCSEQYVVQQSKSSGGLGTFILTKGNGMLSVLKKNYKELFIISPYIHKSFAININAIIGEKNTILLPPSLQLSERDRERIIYHGADYIAACFMPPNITKKLKEYANIILTHIKEIGYRGIIGLDFLAAENQLYFLEINPRYQASSFLINIALEENGLPSLSKMNLAAFYDQCSLDTSVEQIMINYSFYKYLYTSGAKHLYYVFQKAASSKYVKQIVTDGWNPQLPTEEDAYCYSIIFQTNIASINTDLKCDIYSNIHGEEKYLKDNINTVMGLKIALINQGCNITDEAQCYLKSKGLIKKAVFSAIDFKLANGIPINSPINLKFGELSPFTICYDKKLTICHYNKMLSEVTLELEPDWENRFTQDGVPFNRIAYLSTDRLRLKHESICTFKKAGKGCFFCNLPEQAIDFAQSDFDEVLDTLLPHPTFRHILIGGGSGDPLTESNQIISLAKKIRARNKNISIYLMSLPPTKLEILQDYKDAGITEVAFNIEIWDRTIAQKLMPGKGKIPLSHYINALCESTNIWGKEGNVRTALIVGLNQRELLLEATEHLCKMGIQPMFSIFRPMIGTKLESMVPPSNQTLLFLYQDILEICAKYHMEPGPSCKECRNNMLAL
ncbi:MAG: ATP-grasp domain-containing protein [Lachnospira sp.]|nr:ATP-grasp domain-containing protein [Lachnospira sp.]